MNSTCAAATEKSSGTVVVRILTATFAALVMLCLCSITVFGQCATLGGTVSNWTGGSDNWSNGADWVGGVPNSQTQSACINNGTAGTPTVVTLDINASIEDLGIGTYDTLNFNQGVQLSVYGTQIINAGQIAINGGTGNTFLFLDNSVTLSGGGTLTLNTTTSGGGTAYLYQNGAYTLTNVDNTIQGEGLIYNNAATIINEAGGTINANSTGGALTGTLLLEYGNVTNAGLLEATNSGTLELLNNTINNAGGNITANGAGATVQIYNTTVYGGTLNTLNGGTLETVGNATLDGSTLSGAINLSSGSTYTTVGAQTYVLGTINNQGTFYVGGGAVNSYLYLNDSVTLQGGGTITLNTTTSGGGNAYLYQNGGYTLTNVNNTIQGEGIIYNNGATIINEAGGTINANSTGGALAPTLLLEYGTVTNQGVLEATNSGTLELFDNTINNAGSSITASGAGATVQIYDTIVHGGTLNNNTGGLMETVGNATLDGQTTGALTLNGTYTTAAGATTYILGTINNNGLFYVSGGANNTYLQLTGNTTLQGGGTITLNTTASGGGNAYLYGGYTLNNVNNLIQGEGIIYNNGAVLNNQATINANSTGGLLATTLAIEYGTINNTGLLEATNSGTLQLFNNTIYNSGANITAGGAGTTVDLVSTTIYGGTLNNNGGTMETVGTATLDGQTTGALTLNGTYTTAGGATTYILGTINNNNSLFYVSGGAQNTYLELTGNTTLQGGGTITLNTTASGGGNAWLYQSGYTLNNVNNLIQGEGVIYSNGAVLNNQATINANSTGGLLATTLAIEYGTVNNTGLLEATNSGTLQLFDNTIYNSGANITAGGAGTTVDLVGTTIYGGTLNNNGGTMETVGTAILDGKTAGALTLNGTYKTTGGDTTYILGTINNQGNFYVSGGAQNTYLQLNGDTTLQGNGTVTLSTTASGGGNAWLYQSGYKLDNVGNTIQGSGIIYSNGATLINEAGGTIIANSTGSPLSTTLEIDYGTVTNSGTLQANSGNLLHLFDGVLTNFSGNTLTGGTYNVYGTVANPGTLQIDALGNTGGEIVNNAATILLDGPNSNFVDQAGLDALSNFSNNTATGSFTIQDGRNFTSPSDFANAGTVNIGATSTFTTGGAGDYNQSGGSTQLNGALTAGGGQANFNGGVLFGNGGTITGNVMMAGTIVPAAAISALNAPLTPGTLNITGNYTQTGTGIFNLGIAGITPGSQFGVLNATGLASLLPGSTLNISLLNFFPTVGETFTFLNAGAGVSGTFTNVNGLNIGGGEELMVVYNPFNVEIETIMVGTTTDSWLGGTDVWSNAGKWSLGTVPNANNDVIIYSGGFDTVTMNFGSTTINSLQLGGVANGTTSELTDGGNAENLTILNGLNIGASGDLILTGASTVTAATVSNSGHVVIGSNATLNLTDQAGGITDVAVHSSWQVSGNFELGGVANIAFANLTSVEGIVDLENGQKWAISPIGGTLTVGDSMNTAYLQDGNGTTMTINGNVITTAAGAVGADTGGKIQINGNADNFGSFYTHGGSTFNISGTLTNEASGGFVMEGPGDKATIGNGVSNAGGIDVEGGSTLNITGGVDNSGLIITNFNNLGGHNTITVSGVLTNEATGTFELFGPGDKATMAGLTNSGYVDVEGGSTLQINGDVTNSGSMYTSFNGPGGGNTLNITGNLSNSGFVGIENTDTATISGNLTNNLGATFDLTGGGMASIGGNLTNSGTVDLENASTLKITGTADNFGSLTAGANGGTGGNTITITGTLTNEAGGLFELYGHGSADMATIGNGVNNIGNFYVYNSSTAMIGNGLTTSGTVDLENGSTLQITGNSSNSGDLYTDFSGEGGNNKLTITGNLDNTGLVWLKGAGDTANISGAVTNELDAELFLFGGSKATMPGLTNAGVVDVENGSTLQINGDASNSGNLYTNQQGNGGGNKINITGTLTNTGNFELYGPGDTATLGGLNTSAFVDVEHGSTLQINGNASNSADLFTDNSGLGGNNILNITGNLTNTGIVELFGASDKATIGGAVTNQLDAEIFLYGSGSKTTMGSLTNAGTVDVANGSTLQINGAADNSGKLYTNQSGLGGSNTLNITGMLTNEATGMFELFGPGDKATIGSLTNNPGGYVDVEKASTLQINGDATNSGSMYTSFNGGGGNKLNITGNLTNSGFVGLESTGDMATIGGNVTNSGTFDLTGGAMATIKGNLTSSGTVDLENASTLQINGTADNSGTLSTGANGGTGGNMVTVNGLLTNEAMGQITLNGPGDVLQALAGLTNNGVVNVKNGSSIDPPFVNNGGTINIDSLSRLVVGTPTPMGGQGYIQLANGTLGEIINSNSSYGVINVNGSALLDGTLNILLKQGFNPTVGTTFTFLNFTSGQLSGMFANIENDFFNGGTEKWLVSYDNADGYVQLTAENNPVPEPATLLVLIPGLMGMAYGLRRRVSK